MLIIKVWVSWLSTTEIETLRTALTEAAVVSGLSKNGEVQILFPKERSRANRNPSAIIEIIGPILFDESAHAIFGKAVTDLRPKLPDLTVQIFATPTVSMGTYYTNPVETGAGSEKSTSTETIPGDTNNHVVRVSSDYRIEDGYDTHNLKIAEEDEREKTLTSFDLKIIEFRKLPSMPRHTTYHAFRQRVREQCGAGEMMLGARFADNIEKNVLALRWLNSKGIRTICFFGTTFVSQTPADTLHFSLLECRMRAGMLESSKTLRKLGESRFSHINVYYPVLRLPPPKT